VPRGKAPTVEVPIPTGDASMRLERLSANPVVPLWNDITANGNNGTPSDPTILIDFDFDGVVDNVSTSFVGNLQDASKPWTLALWCTRESTNTGIVGLCGTRSGSTGWELRDMNAGGIDQLDFDGFGPYLRTIGIVPAYTDDKWHFVTVTWTPGSPSTMKSYSDGVLHFNNTVAADYTTSVFGFVFGKSPTVFWDGKIDTARIYPRVLSPDEIQRDFYAGMAGHQ